MFIELLTFFAETRLFCHAEDIIVVVSKDIGVCKYSVDYRNKEADVDDLVPTHFVTEDIADELFYKRLYVY